MLKLIPMPNPISLALDNYKMTNTGKALIGSTIAAAALDAYENSQHQSRQYQQSSYGDPVQDTWAFYGQAVQTIHTKPDFIRWWNQISAERKQNAMIQLFLKEGKGHLIPYLQQHVFPTMR